MPTNYGRIRYFRYRDCYEINDRMILLEGEVRGQTAGIIQAAEKELLQNPSYKEYTIVCVAEKNKCLLKRRLIREQSRNRDVKVARKYSVKYFKALAAAKYLVTDRALVSVFTKREEQRYLNLSCCRSGWMTDYAKTEKNKDWNEQKGFFDADSIVCPDKQAMMRLFEAYDLENFAKGKIWITENGDNEKPERLATELCGKFILGAEASQLTEHEIPYNGKKNVLLYLGGFEKNGLTTAGAALLNELDRTKNNYAVIFCVNTVRERWDRMDILPEAVGKIGFFSCRCLSFVESIGYMIWRGFRNTSYTLVDKSIERMSVRGIERIMKPCRVDTVVQFSGYQDEMIGMMQRMPCRRIIFVHSNMEWEMALRQNVRKELLSRAYRAYDAVAVVTEGMIPPTERLGAYEKKEEEQPAPIVLCQNVIDYKRIRLLGEQELRFDDITVFNTGEGKVREALQSRKKKYISIGRFSVEKGHGRLIEAFEQLHREQPETCLFIVGGHGDIWNETVAQVKHSSCPEEIHLICYMSNPYPLLKQCDFFVMSSWYEGFGLGLVEADILGLPCFTVELDGPKAFMEKHGGMMVDGTVQGIYEGMVACLHGQVPERLSVDYEQYNEEAIRQFEAIL